MWFTASNGKKVSDSLEAGLRLYSSSGDPTAFLGIRSAQALREYFADERDRELGRWRSPASPDYVAYPYQDGMVMVLHECDGVSMSFARGTDSSGPHATAARAYFKGHAIPWHQAKEGEVWLVRPLGFKRGEAALVRGQGFEGKNLSLSIRSSYIAEAYRLWTDEEER